MSIHTLLADVMADVTSVEKKDRNDFHKFMFRGVDAVINEVGPALRKHRVLCLPTLQKLESRDVPTDKGKLSREVTVEVAYTFYGPEGDSLTFTVPGEAQDTGDKAVSKAMAVAYRTGMIQALNIPTQEADPDSQSYTRGENLLVAWKRKVMDEAAKRQWDVERLAYEFQTWSEGADIRQSTVEQLEAFHKSLVKSTATKKVARRSQAPETPAPPLDAPAPPVKAVQDIPASPEPSMDWPPVTPPGDAA